METTLASRTIKTKQSSVWKGRSDLPRVQERLVAAHARADACLAEGHDMAELRAMAILVYSLNGSLVRYSREALDMTGYSADQVATLSDWCRCLFQDFESYIIAKDSLEKITLNRDGKNQSCEFSVIFQVLDGTSKMGRFNLVPLWPAGEGNGQLLISILEQPAGTATLSSSTEFEAMDLVSGALNRIKGVISDLHGMVEARQMQLVSRAAAASSNPSAHPDLWDGLFSEAFAMAKTREQLDVLLDSTSIIKQAMH
jgi:PAS domain-containing protein